MQFTTHVEQIGAKKYQERFPGRKYTKTFFWLTLYQLQCTSCSTFAKPLWRRRAGSGNTGSMSSCRMSKCNWLSCTSCQDTDVIPKEIDCIGATELPSRSIRVMPYECLSCKYKREEAEHTAKNAEDATEHENGNQ